MKFKIFSITSVIILILSGLIITPPSRGDNVKQDINQQSEIPIDMDFTLDTINKLTGIIQQKDQNGSFIYWQGRDFGTPGEREAARILKEEVWDEHIAKNNENIPNATLDKIEGERLTRKVGVESQNDYNLTFFFGNEELRPPKSEYFPVRDHEEGIHIFSNAKVHITPNWAYGLIKTEDKETISDKISRFLDKSSYHIYLIEMEKIEQMLGYPKKGEYSFLDVVKRLACFTNADAFLFADYFDDTHFMTPAVCDIPGMTINGSLGKKIKNSIKNGISVEADFYINTKELFVESYNVIGTIPGEVDDIVFVGAHYDSMWCQGACDDSCSVAITFAIAKYFSDNHIKPYYTLKFAAWAGEEYPPKRGSASYINKYKNEEIYKYCFCLAALGFKNSSIPKENIGLNFWSIRRMPKNFKDEVKKIDYTMISGGYRNTVINERFYSLLWYAVDAQSFFKHTISGVFCFAKGTSYVPLKDFYHRDGNNHTKGDTLEIADFDDVNATAQVALSVIKKASEKPDYPIFYKLLSKIVKIKNNLIK